MLRVILEVDAAGEQQRVVHAGHVQHRAGDVGLDRGQRTTGDAALAVAVVEEPLVGRERRGAVELEGRVRGEPVRRSEQPAEVDEVEVALLQPVGQRRELRHVLQRRQRLGEHVVLVHADEVASACDHAVVGAERAHIRGVDLGVVAEQAVPVHRRPVLRDDVVVVGTGSDVGHRGLRDVAGEARVVVLAGAGRLRRVALCVVGELAGRRRLAVGVDEARDLDRAGHLADVLRRMAAERIRVRVDGVVRRLYIGDRVVRRVAIDDAVAGGRVTKLLEAGVADVEHPPGDVARARDGEVPGDVQVRAIDPGPP